MLKDFEIRPVVVHPTKRADLSRHGYQVQTQATLLAYIDAFWALAVLSFAADPLALFLRNVKLGGPAAVTH